MQKLGANGGTPPIRKREVNEGVPPTNDPRTGRTILAKDGSPAKALPPEFRPEGEYAPGPTIPPHLVQELLRGNVVAFVGAGFSRPAGLPLWGSLLHQIALDNVTALDVDSLELIKALAGSTNSNDLDMAAQLLSDKMGMRKFDESLRRKLTLIKGPPEAMQQRLAWLRGIPFSTILTTNYDNMLSGPTPENETFGQIAASILRRSDPLRLAKLAFGDEMHVPVVKLHGCVCDSQSTLVCTREGYRKLLHSSPNYSTFVRTLLATRTVLYLGFSFTDGYLNELRSEVMALFGSDSSSPPLAYALMADVSQVHSEALLRHEGLQVLSFDTRANTNFSGFDQLLSGLCQATNPAIRFGQLVSYRRILWLHPMIEQSSHVRYLIDYVLTVNKRALGHQTVQMQVVGTTEAAMDLLDEQRFDCIVAVMPIDAQTSGTALELLKRVNDTRAAPSPPTLVFGPGHQVAKRRATCLHMGARCYATDHYELLLELTNVLELTSGEGKVLKLTSEENALKWLKAGNIWSDTR